MKSIIALMTPRNPMDLFDEMLGSSDTIQVELTAATLRMVRRDGTQVDPSQVGTLLLQEEGTPLAQYLDEITPDGDGFGGRDARGVSVEIYERVAQALAPMGVQVSRK